MKMSFYGYTYIFACILQNIYYSTKHLASMHCQYLRINKKTPDFFQYRFYEDIDINTIDAYVLPFSHISIVKPRS